MLKKVIGITLAVLVSAALVPDLNAQPVSILSQDFNSAPFPPTGWNQNWTSPSQAWRLTENSPLPPSPYYNRNNMTGGSGYCASMDDDIYNIPYPASAYPGAWLATPTFDGTGYTEIWLALNVTWNDIGSNDWARIEANNGEGWDVVVEWTSDHGYPTGVRDSFDISQWCVGNSNSQIRFMYYETGSTWAWYYQIDNVNIWGTEGGGPSGEDSIDFQMAQIIRPMDVEEANVAFNPTCKVYMWNNIQIDSAQALTADPTWPADVRCRITDLSSMQVVYDKTLSNYPFSKGYTTVSEFPQFTPDGGKNYKALFVVTGADDIDPSNDNLEKNWSTVTGEDVTPTEIIVPADSQVNAFAPSAKFLEKAGVEEAAVVLHYRIEDATYFAIVSEDSVTHDFAANEEYTASFPEVSGLEGAGFTVTFWATNAKGDEISHPELSKPFNYTGVAEKPEPKEFALAISGNVVTYTLAKSTSVSLKVYDAAGNLVSVLASGSMTSGSHAAVLDTKPGVYFVKLVTPEYSTVRKVAVIK